MRPRQQQHREYVPNDENMAPNPIFAQLGPAPNMFAPQVPAAVTAALRNKNKNKCLRAVVHEIVAEPGLLQQIQQETSVVLDNENPHVAEARQSTMVAWSLYLAAGYPDISEDLHWSTDTVQQHARGFLRS